MLLFENHRNTFVQNPLSVMSGLNSAKGKMSLNAFTRITKNLCQSIKSNRKSISMTLGYVTDTEFNVVTTHIIRKLRYDCRTNLITTPAVSIARAALRMREIDAEKFRYDDLAEF